MNTDVLKGKWNQMKGDIKRSWGDLTDDDLKMVEGDRDKLLGKLQERYGYTREEAESQWKKFQGEHRDWFGDADDGMRDAAYDAENAAKKGASDMRNTADKAASDVKNTANKAASDVKNAFK